MHNPLVEGNFSDEHGNTLKPTIVEDFSRHMGYVDKSDHIVNSSFISHYTWKWTRNVSSAFYIWQYSTIGFFLHPVVLNVLTEILYFSLLETFWKKLGENCTLSLLWEGDQPLWLQK